MSSVERLSKGDASTGSATVPRSFCATRRRAWHKTVAASRALRLRRELSRTLVEGRRFDRLSDRALILLRYTPSGTAQNCRCVTRPRLRRELSRTLVEGRRFDRLSDRAPILLRCRNLFRPLTGSPFTLDSAEDQLSILSSISPFRRRTSPRATSVTPRSRRRGGSHR